VFIIDVLSAALLGDWGLELTVSFISVSRYEFSNSTFDELPPNKSSVVVSKISPYAFSESSFILKSFS